jgi:hypothetical protein
VSKAEIEEQRLSTEKQEKAKERGAMLTAVPGEDDKRRMRETQARRKAKLRYTRGHYWNGPE